MNLLMKMLIIDRFGTQLAFAHKLGITELQVSQIIHGRRKPTATQRKLMTRFLGTDEKDLFKSSHTKAFQKVSR